MKKLFSLAILGIFFAQKALAQSNPAPNLFVSYGNNSPAAVIAFITQVLLGITGAIAVFYMIIGGFQIMNGGASADMAERGKKTIRYALTGLIIVILSYIIVVVVANSFE
jgi:hypothetical protein